MKAIHLIFTIKSQLQDNVSIFKEVVVRWARQLNKCFKSPEFSHVHEFTFQYFKIEIFALCHIKISVRK